MTPPQTPSPASRASGDDDPTTVVRREERLLVSTVVRATERVRLERFVVTERRTVTLDVSHEEVRLTREPIRDGVVAPAGERASDRAPVVVVLHEERVVVSTTVVPMERVTLSTRMVTDDVLVEATLGREQIDVDPLER
jgi:uncharacterized protein (TIGR02271 family)